MTRTALALLALVGIANVGAAQQSSLPDRLSPAARTTIERLIDSARAVGLPAAPLRDKAAEGVLKGADDERIVRAVQSLARELGDARTALGTSADASTLGAAASALHAGVTASDLRSLAHPTTGAPAPLALSSGLVTLVDLVAKHVPVATATRSIRELLEQHAGEQQFAALRSDVERDILAGRSPEASLADRARAAMHRP